jgi:hypothetical protein
MHLRMMTCGYAAEDHRPSRCVAVPRPSDGSHREAARLFDAAHAIRERRGAVRFKAYDAVYEASVTALRDALGEHAFDAARTEGAPMSTEEAIAYAQRGRGARKRPTSGWGITDSHRARCGATGQRRAGQQRHRHKAFRLTAHGANPPHPRLHQTCLSSRVQLVQEAARHA